MCPRNQRPRCRDVGVPLRAEFELEANWKISCENFLECYHCAVAHPGFSAAVDVSPDAYRLEARGLVSSQVGPLRQNGNSFPWRTARCHAASFTSSGRISARRFPGHPNLSCGPMLPIAPERTARFLDYFFAPGVDQAWIDELLAFDNQVGLEDRSLVEGVQRGVRSGILTEGASSPKASSSSLTSSAFARKPSPVSIRGPWRQSPSTT